MNSRMIYLIHCKNICKCYNIPPPNTIIKKDLNIKRESLKAKNKKKINMQIICIQERDLNTNFSKCLVQVPKGIDT
jgi:hypothetical protein